jgi:translation initiation factor 4A
VLDEADEMLSRGFKDQVYDVFSRLPDSTQVILSTTKMSADVLELTQRFMRDPIHIVVKRKEPLLEGIRQFYCNAEEEGKLDALIGLCKTVTITHVCVFSAFVLSAHAVKCVIFCNTRRKVEWLADQVSKRGVDAVSLHGDMDKAGRDVVVKEFCSGVIRVLITTDLFRGIDMQHVSLAINYELPVHPESYIYRL